MTCEMKAADVSNVNHNERKSASEYDLEESVTLHSPATLCVPLKLSWWETFGV